MATGPQWNGSGQRQKPTKISEAVPPNFESVRSCICEQVDKSTMVILVATLVGLLTWPSLSATLTPVRSPSALTGTARRKLRKPGQCPDAPSRRQELREIARRLPTAEGIAPLISAFTFGGVPYGANRLRGTKPILVQRLPNFAPVLLPRL